MFNCSHSLTCLYCNRVDHSKHTEIYKQCQREGKIELVFFNINKLLILFSVWKKTNQRFQSQDTHSSHFPHISDISSHVLIKFLIQIFYSICIKKNLLELEFPFFTFLIGNWICNHIIQNCVTLSGSQEKSMLVIQCIDKSTFVVARSVWVWFQICSIYIVILPLCALPLVVHFANNCNSNESRTKTNSWKFEIWKS